MDDFVSCSLKAFDDINITRLNDAIGEINSNKCNVVTIGGGFPSTSAIACKEILGVLRNFKSDVLRIYLSGESAYPSWVWDEINTFVRIDGSRRLIIQFYLFNGCYLYVNEIKKVLDRRNVTRFDFICPGFEHVMYPGGTKLLTPPFEKDLHEIHALLSESMVDRLVVSEELFLPAWPTQVQYERAMKLYSKYLNQSMTDLIVIRDRNSWQLSTSDPHKSGMEIVVKKLRGEISIVFNPFWFVENSAKFIHYGISHSRKVTISIPIPTDLFVPLMRELGKLMRKESKFIGQVEIEFNMPQAPVIEKLMVSNLHWHLFDLFREPLTSKSGMYERATKKSRVLSDNGFKLGWFSGCPVELYVKVLLNSAMDGTERYEIIRNILRSNPTFFVKRVFNERNTGDGFISIDESINTIADLIKYFSNKYNVGYLNQIAITAIENDDDKKSILDELNDYVKTFDGKIGSHKIINPEQLDLLLTT